MDNLLYLRLEAHNPERNHHRRYEIRLGRDLFGLWMVSIRFGRSGMGGQRRTYSDRDPEVIRAIIWKSLERRESSPRRIGCAYRLSEVVADDGIHLDYWLPHLLTLAG